MKFIQSVPPRWWLAALGMLLIYAAIIAVAVSLYEGDRARLVERLREDRLFQVKAAADALEEDVRDVTDDLDFTRRHFERVVPDEERHELLTTLLASSRAYRAIAVYEGLGLATWVEPGGQEEPGALADAMSETAARMLAEGGPEYATSGLVKSDPNATRWYRAFGVRVGQSRTAIVLLVDTTHLVQALRILSADPQTGVVVLGPHGQIVPNLTSTPLLTPAPGRSPEWEALLARMRSGETGTTLLDRQTAIDLGFEPEEVLASYHRIPMHGGAHWSVGTLTSLSVVRQHERTILMRLGSVAAAFGLAFMLFVTFAFVSLRQRALLRQRLRHTEEMNRASELANKILGSIPTGVLVLSEDRIITEVNPAMQAILPCHTGFHIGSAFQNEDLYGRVTGVIDAALHGSTTTEVLEDVSLGGQPEGCWAVTGVPLEPSAPETRMLLVFDDFTALRSLEAQLVRAEKLATIGVLSAGIAHEIGTPLAVIRGRAEYLRDRVPAESPQASGLQIIVGQIDRVSRIMQQLLDFSRLKPKNVSRATPLAPIVGSVLELLELQLRRYDVSVTRAVPDDLPPLDADPDQLQQVLLNLLVNAVDACEDGGHIDLSARLEGEQVVILVGDDGYGIPRELANQIFDPFFTTKKRGKGTGLGLAVVAQIVRHHGGVIEVQSEEGQGTVFTLRWPAAAPAAGGRAPSKEQVSDLLSGARGPQEPRRSVG